MVKRFKILIKSPFTLLSLLVVIYFFPLIFLSHVFYSGDILTIYLPFKTFLFRNLSQGVLPLWNEHVFAGYPFFADMTQGTYYPPSLLLFFGQNMKIVSLLVVFHFFIAASFMYKLGRFMRLTKSAALLVSVVYTFSGVMINYIADPQRFFVISLYPLFFLTFLKALKHKNLFFIIICALSASLQIFAGHIQYVFIEFLFCPFLFFIPLSKKRRSSGLFVLVSILVLAFLFSSISLIPTLEFIPLTTRTESFKHLSIYQSFSLNPITLVRFVLAFFWGIKNQGSAWGTMDTSSIGYVGFLPLVLIFLTLRKLLKKREAFIFLVFSVLSLFVSLGTYLPFFSIFLKFVPLFRFFRNPMVFLSVYTFFISLLSGFAFDFLTLSKRLRSILVLTSLIVFASSTLMYLFVLINQAFPYSLVTQTASLINKNLSSFHTVEVDYQIAQFILINISVLAALATIFFWFKKKYILLFLVFIDLLVFTRSNFYTIEASYLERQNQVASFLKENLGSFRYLSSSEVVPYSGMNDYFGMISFQPPFAKEGRRLTETEKKDRFVHELNLLPQNFSTLHNLSTITGYTSFVIKKYHNYFRKSAQLSPVYQKIIKYNPLAAEPKPEMALSKIDLSKVNFNDKILDKLSVKYLVTDRDLELSHHKLVFEINRISVYENELVEPVVVLLNESNQVIEIPTIVRKDSNMIEIKTEKRGRLVLRDMYYKGWRAQVNEQETAIYPYEDIFKSIEVKNENSKIVFRFQPHSFYFGALVSVLSLLSAFLYLGFYKRRIV